MAGDHRASYELAMLYVSASPFRKSKEIFSLLKKSSDAGILEATYYLGIAYLEDWCPRKSKSASLNNVLKAANAGLPEACNELAVKYEGGVEAPKNLKLAIHWYKKGAMLGDVLAQANLAKNYEKGIGVKVNLRQALNWYEASMLQGFDEAKEGYKRVKKLISKGC